jgi:hypothetical protein
MIFRLRASFSFGLRRSSITVGVGSIMTEEEHPHTLMGRADGTSRYNDRLYFISDRLKITADSVDDVSVDSFVYLTTRSE